MSRIWSFHGGIHPPENKQQSLQRPLRQMPLPERLILPLQQHIGAPATPLVAIGEQVLKGQPIAEPTGFVSIFMHAPTSGTVIDICDAPVPHPSGMPAQCIVLQPDGKEEWIPLQRVEDFKALEKTKLAELIRRAGISGMGGAGFPTDIKLHLSDDHIVNTLILNGVECEPYITADDMLMRERADQIIGGIEIAAHLIKPTHILIGIEDNKPEAAMAMTDAARHSKLDIEVVVVPTRYPSGGERQLIKLLTGVEVPHGQLPADIGIVVQNVGTMTAVYQAVHEGKPLISRITTLTGDALESPGNIEVLLGTPVEDLLEFCGLDQKRLSRLVMGGPMMGFTLGNGAVPVIKTSNCIIAGTQAEFPPPPPAQTCIRCGSCEQVCPAELLPQQLHWFAKGKEFDKALNHNLMDCIECGACSYVCPSNIPLVQYYRFAKAEVRKEQQEQRQAEQARMRFEARQARLEAAEREKQERRQARAAAAAKAQAQKKDTPATSGAAKPVAAGTEDPEARLKQLKTQAAVARTKLKKAQKALQQAQEEGATTLQPLEEAVKAAEQQVEETRKAHEQAQQDAPKAQAPDLKALKIAAATARTKVTKTEKALADAEAKGAPSADKLRSSLGTLRAKAEEAQQAYQQAESQQAPVDLAPATKAPDLKALKSAAAIARTKLKKAQKAVTEARESGSDELPELEQQLQQQQQRVASAEQAYRDAEQQRAANDSGEPDIKALKTAASVARTKLKKTEKALAEARDQGSPAAPQLEKALAGLQAKAEAAQRELEQAQQAIEA